MGYKAPYGALCRMHAACLFFVTAPSQPGRAVGAQASRSLLCCEPYVVRSSVDGVTVTRRGGSKSRKGRASSPASEACQLEDSCRRGACPHSDKADGQTIINVDERCLSCCGKAQTVLSGGLEAEYNFGFAHTLAYTTGSAPIL